MAENKALPLPLVTLQIKPDWKLARLDLFSRWHAGLGDVKWLRLLLWLGFVAVSAKAQTSRVASIGEVIRNGSDYSPVHLGEEMTVVGIVTDEPHDVGSGNTLGNLQDATGGIAIFGGGKIFRPGAFQRGDVIEAHGKVSQYRGMEELIIEEVHRTGTAKVPAPREVLAAELSGEGKSGQLVRVSGQLISQPGGRVVLQDRSGQIPVYLFHSFFQNTGFMKRLLQGGYVEVIGLARQRVNEGDPPNSGYLLSPRSEADFRFGPLSRYREMVIVALAVLIAFIYLWLQRRGAERRARELTILSEGLRESEERFRQMAENIDQIFWMLDIRTEKILYVSPAFERVWGFSGESLNENRSALLDTVHPDDRDRVRTYMEKITTDLGEEYYRIVRPDGGVRWIHDRAFPVVNHEGKRYRVTGIAEDITDQKVLEDQLRQSQKMEAVGTLAGGIAHDFNNLLTIIGGYAQMLLDGAGAENPGREKLEQIVSATNHASTLTSQLLAFSRRQVLQPKVLQVNNLLSNMAALLGRVMGEHITVRTVLSTDLRCVKADPNQLEQVFINLAANARDAMPNGGQFTIETAMSDSFERGPERDLKATKWVRLKVSDTGFGMDSHILEHAFEPFFTTKGVGKGTGLGLSTVYGIVRQNHGTIRITSEQGQGTVFEIYLPIAEEEEEGMAQSVGQSDSWHGNEIILVAEDEPNVRKMVCATLVALGYTVLEAADGHEAFRILERGTPVHLLLTDVIMPLMNGPELAKRLKSAQLEIKVLYMSGYTDDMLAFHGMAQSDVNFIQKPFAPAALAEKLRQMLSHDSK